MKSSGPTTILRWGLAFVFFYAALASLAYPERWTLYIPAWITAFVSARIFLTVFSCYQLVLAVWLFIGKKLAWVSFLATLTLTAIVVADFRLMGVVFGDVGLAFAALALFELSRNNNQQ
jgi:hypothetical protein